MELSRWRQKIEMADSDSSSTEMEDSAEESSEEEVPETTQSREVFLAKRKEFGKQKVDPQLGIEAENPEKDPKDKQS